MEGEKLIMGLKKIVNQWTFGYEIRKKAYFRLSSLLLYYVVVKFGATTFLENHGKK
jgi:hypothetical protein